MESKPRLNWYKSHLGRKRSCIFPLSYLHQYTNYTTIVLYYQVLTTVPILPVHNLVCIGNYTVREVLKIIKNRTRVWRNVYNTASA